MKKIKNIKRVVLPITFFLLVLLCFIWTCPLTVYAEDETMPDEYSDFIGSLDGSVSDMLPEGVFSNEAERVEDAADELIAPAKLLSIMIDSLGVGIHNAAPTLALVLGIVILSAILSAFSSSAGGISRAVENCTRLCTFTSIAGLAVGCAESLTEYFDRLFSAVAAFVPLSGALYAMGGNLTCASGGTVSVGVTLAVCQFFCTKTVIPVFCLCLCLSLLSVFEGQGAYAGGAVSATVRKWYTTSLAFVMMILTCSLTGSTILASKADNMAMRGAKFAVSSFVPLSGGTVSSTLGTLAASVELLRSSVGVIGIVIIILMLLPTVIELALLRGVFAIGGFCASVLGCSGEARLLSELDSLYGYLEGIAVLASAVFIIAFGIFASISTPFG